MFHQVGLNVIEAKQICKEVWVKSIELDKAVVGAMNAAGSVGSGFSVLQRVKMSELGA